MIIPDDQLDDEFPLGDGTAATQAEVSCPYCGEINQLMLDPGSGPEQEYVEDCQVCCRPWRISVQYDSSGEAQVTLVPENP